jgi:hypothetical protein
VAVRGASAREDRGVAGGIRFVAVAFVTVVAATGAAAGQAAAGPSPARSTPAATPQSTPAFQPAGAAGNRRDPAAGVALVRPSSESDDVTRLLLLLLAGLLVLVVIPIQVAKGIAQRRRRPAQAPIRLRGPRRRP